MSTHLLPISRQSNLSLSINFPSKTQQKWRNLIRRCFLWLQHYRRLSLLLFLIILYRFETLLKTTWKFRIMFFWNWWCCLFNIFIHDWWVWFHCTMITTWLKNEKLLYDLYTLICYTTWKYFFVVLLLEHSDKFIAFFL